MKLAEEDSAPLPAQNRFINPHRLFHGVWLPQWLEERPEVSEKAKKLYAYLTYFAGGKGYAWPSFNHLAERLHISRRYVIKLVQKLSAHGLITTTHVNNSAKGHRTNYYRFLWHPWMQTAEDGDFRMVVPEEQAPFPTAESDPSFTPPSDPQFTKENNKKRINIRGKVPATSSGTSPSKVHSTAVPTPKIFSDTTKIILERRVAELRREIAAGSKRGNHDRAQQLHAELVEHQTKLGFIPDDPPPKLKASRKEELREPTTLSDWPSPEEVRATFNEARRSIGWPIRR
jgi:DNA-binding Lrp family transcriptional regulator